MRGDITWPGGPGGLVPKGAADAVWLPTVGKAELVVLTRDKKIRNRTVERQALLDHGVRACFLTSGAHLNLFGQLQLWLRFWDDIEQLVEEHLGPWLASVTKQGVRLFDSPAMRTRRPPGRPAKASRPSNAPDQG